MTHPDDGTLLTFLDGELAEDLRSTVASHLTGCDACTERLRALEGERSLLAVTLPQLDVPASLEAAREAVRVRLGRAAAKTDAEQVSPNVSEAARGLGAREASAPRAEAELPSAGDRLSAATGDTGSGRSRIRWVRPELAKAAGLVLVFAAAAAAAIPGSPVRAWLAGIAGPGEVATPMPEPAVESTEIPAPVGDPQEVGIQMDPGGGELMVSLSGLPPGAEVQVLLVTGIRSWVYAAEGARFQTRPGAVEAEVPGQYVRVELARSLALASVRVDGVLYLRKTGDRLELAGPKRDSTDAEIRFEVP